MDLFDKIIDIKCEKNMGLCGMTDEFFCIYISKLFKTKNDNILILTSTLFECNKMYSSLKNYMDEVLLFPMDDFLTSESIAVSPELKTVRLDTLEKLTQGGKYVVLCHLDSYLRFLPDPSIYISSQIKITVGEKKSRESLINQFYNLGYSRESIVTNSGEFGIRGYILDIYPINNDYPIRIEFFDDEIESIRCFDPETQKSKNELLTVIIKPNTEFLTTEVVEKNILQKYYPNYTKKHTNIEAYMKKPIVFVKNYSQIKAAYKKELIDMFEYNKTIDKNFNGKYMFSLSDFNLDECIHYNTLDNLFDKNKYNNIYSYGVKTVPQFYENIESINDYIKVQLSTNKTVVICLKEHQINALLKFLNHKYVLTTLNNIFDNIVNIVKIDMCEGFMYGNYIFLTPKELYNKKIVQNYKSRFKYTSKIKSISNLEIGDYVVHSTNGIGIYNGIRTLTKNGIKKDYLEVLYADSDKLFIPVEKIELIGKYTGKEGISPKINKLGSTEWIKTKTRVRTRVHDIAKKLLELYALRKLNKGFAFSKDNELQLMFENEFEYEPTKDQIKSINQIKEEMEKNEPMDMLLCGDVGYGKTEVAFRAMFKAVCNSKQVLYLCPTTILSMQQFNNAKERFSNYPVNIEIINRFTSYKKSKEIYEKLSNGSIDILIGTHKLLNEKISPKDLGLLVVDEEKRFGVSQKEKLKEYKSSVDVLTLTATPIPRTLQMSLVGMKSLSLIETPPMDKYPVQTYVIEENQYLIKDAIYKELARNGQVFILYNNVRTIENKMNEISKLVPEARIVFAHGQLDKNEIESKMIDFVNYKYDVMVCTTIIETGIDIPNVNTLIIYNADSFGLSQLYQLRGRVGRGNRIAYAYLMYKKDKVLSEAAEKRLNAIKEFTELGSGFSIASRDLSIRGAGDILGSEQAGFIDSIGIDLYLKILNQEVERLKGNVIEEETVDTNTILNVETHVSDSYVEEEDLKIEIHKLISTINSYETLLSVKEEIEDRFGKIDEKIEIYMYEEWFETLVKKLNITKIRQTDKEIELSFDKDNSNKIDGEQLFTNAINLTKNFEFSYNREILKIKLKTKNLEKHYIFYLTNLLSNLVFKEE